MNVTCSSNESRISGSGVFLCLVARLWFGLFLLLLGKLVDQFDQHEDTESHDEEVEAGLQKVAIVDGSRQAVSRRLLPR